MRYYALFYTAIKEDGTQIASMLKTALDRKFEILSRSEIQTTITNVAKRKHEGLRPDTLIDHFIVEITEKEYERDEAQT